MTGVAFSQLAPPNGMQPQFIVTIQPTGAMFDPPARLTLPNVDGHAPGRQVEMFSYDHDLEEFVAIGLGSVSKDGKTITSNPGVGVVKAGWHCGAQPGGSGTSHDCPTCYNCEDETCVYDSKQDNRSRYEQVVGDCQTVLCSGALKDEPMDRPSIDIIRFDCKQPGCDGGTPNYAKDPADDISEVDVLCNKCDDGKIIVDPAKEGQSVNNEDPNDCKMNACKSGDIEEVLAPDEQYKLRNL